MRRLPLLGAIVLATTVSGSAGADGEVPAPAPATVRMLREHGEIAATGGYMTPPVRMGSTPFGFGGGAKLGYTFGGGVYLGGRVIGFLGSQDVDVTTRSVLYGPEIGYALRAPIGNQGAFVLRPQVGFGGLTVLRTDPSGSTSSTSGTTTTTTTRRGRTADTVSGASGQSGSTTGVTGFYVEPALAMMYGADSSFVGATAGALFVPSIQGGGSEPSQWLAYSLSLQLGLLF